MLPSFAGDGNMSIVLTVLAEETFWLLIALCDIIGETDSLWINSLRRFSHNPWNMGVEGMKVTSADDGGRSGLSLTEHEKH